MMYDPEFNSAHFEWRSVSSVSANQTNLEGSDIYKTITKQMIDSLELWVTD